MESVEAGKSLIRNKRKERMILIPTKLATALRSYCAKKGIVSGAIFITRTGKPMDRSNIWRMINSQSRKPVPVKHRSTVFFSGIPYLSLAEYAHRRGVLESDVCGGIQRGELRTAVEEYGEWKVPADTECPDGGFVAQTYTLSKKPLPENALLDYPFLVSLATGQSFRICEDESGNYSVSPLLREKSKGAEISLVTLSREEQENLSFVFYVPIGPPIALKNV